MKFTRNDRGVVAVVVALAMVPLVLATGAAVDVARAYAVKARLGAALDAAGLAVGSADPTRADLEDLLRAYFDANFPDHKLGTSTSLDMTIESGEITLTASAYVETTFLKIINKDSFHVHASAKIIRETKGLEAVLVMDNTGSMGSNNKINDLKSAAQDLVDILFGDEAVAEKLYVGLVPFSGSVNVNPDNTTYINDFSGLNWGTTSWEGCVLARDYPNDVEDSSPTDGGNWDALHWADHDWYNNWCWNGCTSFNIDSTPPSSRGPNKECPLALTPLTNVKADLAPKISSMWASGYTHINYGAVWGWRVLSPDPPFTEGVPYGEEGWNKAIIILTDGANTTSDSHYTAYGYRSDGLLGSTSSSGTSQELDDRLLEICNNMKALDIIVYTITFQLYDTDTQNLFSACATDPSKYFNSPSGEELRTAFRAIGAELSNLRIAQ